MIGWRILSVTQPYSLGSSFPQAMGRPRLSVTVKDLWVGAEPPGRGFTPPVRSRGGGMEFGPVRPS
eukprot:7667141-Lingulodinium_polyedra.AAC.1